MKSIAQQNNNLKLGDQLVYRVMKQQFSMSYRKMKQIPTQANLPRATVLRQKYALVLLPLLASGKRIINIDESWLPHLDFRNHKWAPKG